MRFLVLLTLLSAPSPSDARGCSFDDVAVQNPRAESQRKEVYLGFVLPVHHYNPNTGHTCGFISETNMIYLETFFWAIDSHNSRQNSSSSQTQLRGVVFDSCGSPDLFYDRLRRWQGCTATPDVAKQNMIGYISYDNGAVTARAAKLFNDTQDVLFSISPHNPELIRKDYPLFYQMTPTIQQQSSAIVNLLRDRAWQTVSVVYVDDVYGRSALRVFSDEASRSGINIHLIQHLNPRADKRVIQDALENMRRSLDPGSVVVVFAFGSQTGEVYNHLSGQAVIVSASYFDDLNGVKSKEIKGLALQYNPPGDKERWLPQFSSHLHELILNRADAKNPWFESYLLQKLKCGTSQTCGANTTLGNVTAPSPGQTLLITNAVDVMAKSFRDGQKPDCADNVCFAGVKRDFKAALLTHLSDAGLDPGNNNLKNWDYTLFSTEMKKQKIIYREVGSLKQTDAGLTSSVYGLTDVFVERPVPIILQSSRYTHGTRYDLGHSWVIAIGVLAGLGIILVIVTAIVILVLKMKKVTMSNLVLYAILLFGAFIGYLTLFAFIPIPTTATCGITRFGIGLSYGICLAVMVVIALKMFKDGESSHTLKVFLYFVLVLLIVVEIVILVMWLIVIPPMETLVVGNSGEVIWMCNHFTSDLVTWSQFMRTDFENHLMALIFIMVLVLLLIILGLLVFMKRRKMLDPMYTIKATLLLVAGIGTALLWIAWALVGGLLKHHDYAQEFADGALAFGLWFILTLLVILLLIQLILYWMKHSGKLYRRRPQIRNIKVEHIIENTHVTESRPDEHIALEKTTSTTQDATIERPIKIIENTHITTVDGGRTEDLRNHVNRTNGKVVTTKHVKSEIHREAQTLPRDKERYTAHMSQAKLSGTSDNLRHQPHHHVTDYHSSGHDSHVHHSTGHSGNGTYSCSECGFTIDPHALRLIHPKSEKGSIHNSSALLPDSSVHVLNGDTSFAHSDLTTHTTQEHHPIYTKSPYSVYSTTPIYYSNRRPESMHNNQRVMRISREASGRAPSRYGMSFSEYDRVGYPKRSFRRTKSEEQLGSL